MNSEYFEKAYSDYKVRYIIENISSAKNVAQLRDAIVGVNFFDIADREDVKEAFEDKIKELGLDLESDKLYDWCDI